MNARHVLIVPAWWPSPEQPLGGAFVMEYARAFMAAGMQVGVVFPDLVSARYWRLGAGVPIWPRVISEAQAGVPVIRIRGAHTALGRPRLQMQRYLRWLRRGCLEYAQLFGMPDVVHAHCAIPAGWAALQLVEVPGPPVVITEHTGPFSLALTPASAGDFTRAAIGRAAAVVAVSPQLRDQMIAANIDRNIEVIPNPVAPDFKWEPQPLVLRSDDGRPVYRLVFVGRLVSVKGVHELADAAERLAASPEYFLEWHIVGGGPEESGLRERLRALVAQRRVHFHGQCERREVAKILAQSHLFVLPSHGESGALAAAEALMSGRPAIGTAGTACENVIGPQDGALCRARDSASLVAAIGGVLREYDRWDSRGIADRARARFDSELIAARYAEVFGRVLG